MITKYKKININKLKWTKTKEKKPTGRKKKTNEKKEKKSELTWLTRQTRLIHQTWDSCHENLITKYKKT